MKLLAASFALALAAFGQNDDGTLVQFQSQWRVDAVKREAETRARYVTATKKELGYFELKLELRTKQFEALKESLEDGDVVLIEKSLSNISDTHDELNWRGESLVKNAKELLRLAAWAYKEDYIDKAQYLELRTLSRTAESKRNEPIPANFAKLIDEAKLKVPEHYAHLKNSNRGIY